MNRISELFDNAIEKKEFRNLKDDVLKLIGNSYICDVKKKIIKKIIKKDNKKEKKYIVMLKEKATGKIIIKKKIVMIAKTLIMIMIRII